MSWALALPPELAVDVTCPSLTPPPLLPGPPALVASSTAQLPSRLRALLGLCWE